MRPAVHRQAPFQGGRAGRLRCQAHFLHTRDSHVLKVNVEIGTQPQSTPHSPPCSPSGAGAARSRRARRGGQGGGRASWLRTLSAALIER